MTAQPQADASAAPSVLFSADDIARRIETLADDIAGHADIRAAHENGPGLLAVCALNGGFVFAADLLRALSRRSLDAEVAFVQPSSYGLGTTSSGTVDLVRALNTDIGGRTILYIDDILDSGRTLSFMLDHFRALGARTVYSAVLLDKPSRRAVPVEPDFAGFQCPDVFVVGYGMDAAQRYRGLPFVGTLGGQNA